MWSIYQKIWRPFEELFLIHIYKLEFYGKYTDNAEHFHILKFYLQTKSFTLYWKDIALVSCEKWLQKTPQINPQIY